MTYLEFLGRWYNLAWLAAIAAGLVVGMARRLAGRRPPPTPRASVGVALVAAGVVGLTLNGAIHDFRLGSIAARMPFVVPLALGAGWLVAWGASRLRHRFAPPIRGVAFNRPGLAGREAVVLSAGLRPDGTGRARHRDEAGIAHVVRIHLADDPATREAAGAPRLGRRVRLGEFDPERRSYPIDV